MVSPASQRWLRNWSMRFPMVSRGRSSQVNCENSTETPNIYII